MQNKEILTHSFSKIEFCNDVSNLKIPMLFVCFYQFLCAKWGQHLMQYSMFYFANVISKIRDYKERQVQSKKRKVLS